MLNRTAFLLSSLLLFQFASQCKTQPATGISGQIKLTAGWRPVLYLLQAPGFKEIGASYTGVVLDSARIDAAGNVRFDLAGKVQDAPELFFVCIQKNESKFKNQLSDDDPGAANYMPVILKKGDQWQFSAESAAFQASFVILAPDAQNAALLHLRDIRLSAFKQFLHPLDRENHDEAALLETEDALKSYKKSLADFADTVSSFLPAMVAVRWINPDTDYEREPELLVRQCAKWQQVQHPYLTQLCAAASKERLPVLLGDPMPNAFLPMSGGDSLQLYTLLGSKLTILDIWASWCAPCRKENREVLAPVWAQYREKGLNIIGYSIDSSPGAWRAAIAKDGATWPHASHLSGDATPFMEALRITTIPANFLLDENGKIVAKNLHGEALKTFVDQWMQRQ